MLGHQNVNVGLGGGSCTRPASLLAAACLSSQQALAIA